MFNILVITSLTISLMSDEVSVILFWMITLSISLNKSSKLLKTSAK